MEEEAEGGVAKKFLYLNRKAPHGTIYALESLEVVLIAAAFDQDQSFMLVEIDGRDLQFRAISRTGQTVDSGTIKR